MNMDKEKWIIFSVIGVGIGLMLFSAYRYYEHQERKEARRLAMEAKKAQIAQAKIASEPQVLNKPVNTVRHSKTLAIHDYFNRDITYQVPMNASEQLGVFALIRSEGMTGQRLNTDCQENNIRNSFKQTALGFRLQSKQNYQAAKQCYFFAAEKGNAYAANRLGELYLLGLGVEQDLNQARLWFEKSANTGYYFPKINLAVMYLDIPITSETVRIDPINSILYDSKKFKYMKMGAKADLEKGKYWLSQAVKQNSIEAQLLMEHFNFKLKVLEDNRHSAGNNINNLF